MKKLSGCFKHNRKRYIAGLLAFAMTISVCSVTGLITKISDLSVKAEAVVDSDGKFNTDIKDTTKKLGSKENPFVVLEVVPNLSMASFGYLVQGQEPVNVKGLNPNDDKEKDIIDNIGSYIEFDDSETIEEREFGTLLTDDKKSSMKLLSTATQYGTFKKVGDNTGNYNLIYDHNHTNEGYEYNESDFAGDYCDNAVWDPRPNLHGIEDAYNNGKKFFVVDKTKKIAEYDSNKSAKYSGYIKCTGQTYYYDVNNTVDITYYKYVSNYTLKEGESIYSLKFKSWHTVFYEEHVNGSDLNWQDYTIYQFGEGDDRYKRVSNNKGTYKEEEINPKDTYDYSIVDVGAGNGNYTFEGLKYSESVDCKNSDYPFALNNLVRSDKVMSSTDSIKGCLPNIDVYVKLKKGKSYTNTDVFKKFGIGLGYKDNDRSKGEEVSQYEFLGWYTDKYGVNKFNQNSRISANTNLYAKWRKIYPSDELKKMNGVDLTPDNMYEKTFTVSFDAGLGEATEAIADMPEKIEYIQNGSQLVAPASIPKRDKFIFTGWYYNDTLYDFSTSVTKDITLTAHWKELGKKTHQIIFNANTINSTDRVENMPASIMDYCDNGMTSTFQNAEPSEPTCSGYYFAGWFTNERCSKEFIFGRELNDMMKKNDVINLYAKWVPKGKTNLNKLIFNSNADPNDKDNKLGNLAEPDMSNVHDIVAKESGKIDQSVEINIPKLEGNLSHKLNNYNVKVITMSAADLNSKNVEGETNNNANNNRELIKKANLIVINQRTNVTLQSIFKDGYGNENLFGKRINNSTYTDKAYKFTKFSNNTSNANCVDIDWQVAKSIFEVTSIGPEKDGNDIVPVIYDYSILNDPTLYNLKSDQITALNNMKYVLSDGTTEVKPYDAGVYEKDDKSSSANVYKLYLMMEQIKPATLYNAYLSVNEKDERNNKSLNWITNSGKFKTKKDTETEAWSNKTLLPIEAMSSDDWDNYKTNHEESYVAQVIGFNDNPFYDKNTINNRTIVMATKNSMLSELVSRKSVEPDDYMTDLLKSADNPDNKYDTIDGLYYLIHSNRDVTNFTNNISVLEIQPTGQTKAYKNEQFWFWYVSKYVDNFTGRIEHTKISTWEIVGNIDDFNSKYDVIYFGTSIASMKDKMKSTLAVNSDNKTIIYNHLGKVIDMKASLAGLVDDYVGNGYGKADSDRKGAYSGNDITNVIYKRVLSFAEAGYPVVFGREFLVNSGPVSGKIDYYDDEDDPKNTTYKINTKLIDKSSYVYKLVRDMKSPKYSDSCFFENQYNAANTKSFVSALSTKKFSLTMKSKPIEYHEKDNGSYQSDADRYINGNDVNSKHLNFEFKINSPVSKTYTLKVYIDTNADGKFDKEEQLDSLEITDSSNADSAVRYNNLIGGHEYKVSRVIEDYVGAIPWKLEVTDNLEASSGLVRCSEYGICAIKATSKKDLNILHILPVRSQAHATETSASVYFPTDAEIDAANKKKGEINDGNRENYFDGIIHDIENDKYIENTEEGAGKLKNAGNFYYYLSQLDDFKVHFTRLSVTQFENRCSDKYNDTHPDEKSLYEYMRQFDMIILGFSDCYSDVNSKACDVIYSFINDGKTVLFTHDNTSFINIGGDRSIEDETKDYNDKYRSSAVWQYWGYHINKYFRKILGVDRFDVTTNRGDYESYDDESKPNDYPYKQGFVQNEKDYTKLEQYKGKLLNHGYTNVALLEAAGNNLSEHIHKSNYGQITSYPYNIPDDMTVSPTHSQYYQLDLEDDDTVVWYALDNVSDKNSFYSERNDVRNNYYIYNKGNITYSGVGHNCRKGMPLNEVKLFVNTMIAAYRATVQPTVPEITNADKSTNNNDTDFVYVDYDATTEKDKSKSTPFGEGVFANETKKTIKNAESFYDQNMTKVNTTTKRVFFRLKNNSIVMNKKLTVHLYPAFYNSSGEFTPLIDYMLPLEVHRIDNENDRKSKNGGTEMQYGQPYEVRKSILTDNASDSSKQTIFGPELTTNDEYYVDIPINDEYYSNVKYTDSSGKEVTFKALDDENDFAVQIQVIMRYGKNLNYNEPLKGIRNVLLMRRGMFLID